MNRYDRLNIGRLVHRNSGALISKVALLNFLLCAIFTVIPVASVTAATIGEEFVSDGSFQPGVVVGVKQDDPESIELVSIENSSYMIGVVNQENSNTVTYAKEGASTTVSIVGEVPVFVTDANGEIKKGDFVGASWIEGVAMKASNNTQQKLLGVALEDFSPNEEDFYGEIDTSDGKKEVNVGAVKIRLFDKENSFQSSQELSGLEGLLARISGKNVSAPKAMVASSIFAMSVLIAGFFVNSSIRGSFIAIGRNPMASSSIFQSLVHVTMVSVIIILIGTTLSYVVLVI